MLFPCCSTSDTDVLLIKVNQLTWKQLINLYPHLVELTASDCLQIGRALRDTLHQYADLLRPPTANELATRIA